MLYGGDGDGSGSLGAGLGRLLLCLLDNLESKARGYKADPLAALFMVRHACHAASSPWTRRLPRQSIVWLHTSVPPVQLPACATRARLR